MRVSLTYHVTISFTSRASKSGLRTIPPVPFVVIIYVLMTAPFNIEASL